MESPDDDLDDDTDEVDDEEYEEKACVCRCGEYCRRLLIEVDVEDAEREP